MERREFIINTAATGTGLLLSVKNRSLQTSTLNKKMGISVASYAIRWRSNAAKKMPGFENALRLLQHCSKIGAGGLQVGVRNWTTDFAKQVRTKRENLGLYLEGQISLPEDKVDLIRFERELKAAVEAGVRILRCVCLSGRRYEDFESTEAFQQFRKKAIKSLTLAEPIAAKHQIKLAVENHKDWRIEDLLAILKIIESPWIGVTLDTGNNISLIEDPMTVIEKLAPYAITTHFKDMDYRPDPSGFLLAEVPLGRGIIDLNRTIDICEKYNSNITYNLEMITRDPLSIPCFQDRYWATFANRPALDLARMMQQLEQRRSGEDLPKISHLDLQDQLSIEEKNNIDSIKFARNNLGFS